MELREKLLTTLKGMPSLKKHESEIKEILKTSSDIKNAIRKELDFIHEPSARFKLEEIRSYDMLSFMYNIYGDEENTMKYIDMALQLDPSNIISLTCKAYFFLAKEERLMEVKDIIQEVNDAVGKEYPVIQAHAEIAYAFSRCGLKMYSNAIARYESVIENASRFSDANQPIELTTNICIWTFNLAFIKKRLLNTWNMINPVEMTESLKAHRSVVDLLKDVIKKHIVTETGLNKVIQLYRARALVEIGILVDSVQRNKTLFPGGVSDLIPDCDSKTSARMYIDQALAMSSNDAFVLQRCGKFYRYNKEIDLSISLLQQAVSIKPSSFSLHHLALSLKRSLEMKSPEWNHGGGRGSGRYVSRLQYGHTGSRERANYTTGTCRQEPNINRSVSLGIGNGDSGFASMSFLPHQNERRLEQKSQYSDYQQLAEQLESLELAPSEICAASEVSCTESYVNTFAKTPTDVRKHTPNERFNSSSNRRGRGRLGWREYQPFGRSMSEVPPRNRSFENMIKSPKKVIYIDTKNSFETIATILDYLDRAIEMNNTAALYDKGLFLRQIKDSAQAYDIFKKVIFKKDERSSLVLLANSYEQAAYCISELQLHENDRSKELDMRYYLKRSVEVSCNLVAKIPFLKHCWQAAPTLLDFLKRRAKTTETLRDIGFLYEKMENYEDAIDVYIELLETVKDTGELEEKIEIITNLIKTYIHTKRFDDAVLAFDTIMCLPDGRTYIDDNLYIDVHIEGALQSLMKGEHVMAQLRLKNALQFNENTNEDSQNTEETRHDENDDIGQKFDIYILCDGDRAENKFTNLLENLKSIGLSVTLNAIDVPPGQRTMEGMSYAMEASNHFIIALESKPTGMFSQRVAMINQILQKRNNGNMVILAPPNFELPTWLYGYRVVINSDVEFEKDADVNRILNNPSLRSKLKDIISTLSRQREAL